MSKSPARENVVIVGGGLGGTVLAKELSAKLDHSKYNLIVVEARPYLIWMLGGARLTVTNEKDAVDDYLFNYDKFFPVGKGTVKKAKVEKIVPNSDGNGGELELAGGEVLPYKCASTPNYSGGHNHLTVSQTSRWRLGPSGLALSTSQRPTPTFVNSYLSGSNGSSPRRTS
jgi:choline dehydrogenase-like flavoprotein